MPHLDRALARACTAAVTPPSLGAAGFRPAHPGPGCTQFPASRPPRGRCTDPTGSALGPCPSPYPGGGPGQGDREWTTPRARPRAQDFGRVLLAARSGGGGHSRGLRGCLVSPVPSCPRFCPRGPAPSSQRPHIRPWTWGAPSPSAPAHSGRTDPTITAPAHAIPPPRVALAPVFSTVISPEKAPQCPRPPLSPSRNPLNTKFPKDTIS